MTGEALRLIRVFHDEKLTKLAKAIEVSPGYLSDIEKGKKEPTMTIINKYSQHFEMPASSILFFKEDLEKKSVQRSLKNNIRLKLMTFLKHVEKQPTHAG